MNRVFRLLALLVLVLSTMQLSAKEPLSFEQVNSSRKWKLRFEDSCTGNWEDKWFLDGKIARVETSEDGMNLIAGPEFRNDAHHSVLWTKDSFKGDVKIEYEYTRTEDQLINVNILYIQAQGIGEGVYDKDISKWNHLREIPRMGIYYESMNPLHISYAAFPMVNTDPKDDYLRVRKYPISDDVSFHQMEVEPTYYNLNLFLPNVTYKVTVIKSGDTLYMDIVGDGRTHSYSWDISTKEKLEDGRIGLRHMYTRSASYKNFKIYTK